MQAVVVTLQYCSIMHMSPNLRLSACLVLSLLAPVRGFYLPGVAPKEYEEGSTVNLKVNALTSVQTQLPYSYYTLPFCKPDHVKQRVENLGEILGGDDIENSPYDIKMKTNMSCHVLCKRKLTDARRNIFRRRIDRGYAVNWIIDNLPAQTKYVRTDVTGHQDFIYRNGFPVGLLKKGKYFVHNHVRITLKYHANPDDYKGYRIVGFIVEPHSIMQSIRDEGSNGHSATCRGGPKDRFDLDEHDEIWYTYDVLWTYSEVRWASRWDNYLQMEGGQIHWLSILNSALIVLFLSGLVALILLRTLHRDIVKYNELATSEEKAEETGWKLVHGDVFRAPEFPKVLAASVGCGVQLLGMGVVTIFFAALGFLSPAHRGGLLQSTLLLFTFMGIPGGYASARLYKVFGGEEWKETTMLTALLFPGCIFGIFFFLNILIWGESSAGSVPFTTLFALLVLWFGISVPLVFLGSYLGFRQPPPELPARVNQVPREIPVQPWYMGPKVGPLFGGLLPFGAVFTELYFIMSSIWQHQIYYMFGFLVLVLLILVITCAEISISLTYFQLTSEDYQWWWRSFLSSGTSGVYVLLYSVLYFSTQLQIAKTVSMCLYFGYMFVMATVFGLVTGSIGMMSTFVFVRAIYGSIKVD
jgi:transmembrane 9 superfamily protein 2/4